MAKKTVKKKRKSNGRWKDIYLLRAYEMVKEGIGEVNIAAALGIHLTTLKNWQERKPLFKLAFVEGRRVSKMRRQSTTATFRDYVYDRLSSDLREVWNKINSLDEKESGIEKIEAILKDRGVRVRQHLFVYAWVSGNFSISQAMRKVNISRAVFNQWKNRDPEFAQLIDEIQWHKKNFFEDHLCTLVAGGDTAATLFVNRTYNRDRGYDDGKSSVNVNMSGEIKHTFIPIEDLDLTIDTRREILKAAERQVALN